MASSHNASSETKGVEFKNIRLSVSDFGPIEQGEVDLRPLTVFVGPSNSGKTYFAVMLYALHQRLSGFPRLPLMDSYYSQFWQAFERANAQVRDKEFLEFLVNVATNWHKLRLKDLPPRLHNAILAQLNDNDTLATELDAELGRCFDLDTVSDLIRWPENSKEASIQLVVREQNQDLWGLKIHISKSGISAEGFVENPLLAHQSSRTPGSKIGKRLLGMQGVTFSDPWEIYEVLDRLDSLINGDQQRSNAYYLPAARSGIMQSHRVIASSLVRLSTRAGLRRLPEFPTFSGVMADFMERLIFFEGRQKTSSLIHKLATALEEDTLEGQIRTRRTSPEAYPEFVYHQKEAQEGIGLTRASSMVSELAPVVLFLREVIDTGDLLIMEEPEAHLHPAAQTQMARMLGRMIRAGLQVVITTHSDWLLKEIGNLIREGELADRTNQKVTQGAHLLRPDEVGIWLFRKDTKSGASTVEEVPFDRSEGIELQDYEDVEEELYNQSAKLQNRWEETYGGSKDAWG